jgi:hypothetical protein
VLRLRATILSCLAAAAIAAAVPMTASAKLYECQHPTVTGYEAYDLHHIRPATACAAVRALWKWEQRDHHVSQLYRCTAHPGRPILKRHRFDGYTLRIARSGAFVMSRGRSSFSVTGTDFPLNCT